MACSVKIKDKQTGNIIEVKIAQNKLEVTDIDGKKTEQTVSYLEKGAIANAVRQLEAASEPLAKLVMKVYNNLGNASSGCYTMSAENRTVCIPLLSQLYQSFIGQDFAEDLDSLIDDIIVVRSGKTNFFQQDNGKNLLVVNENIINNLTSESPLLTSDSISFIYTMLKGFDIVDGRLVSAGGYSYGKIMDRISKLKTSDDKKKMLTAFMTQYVFDEDSRIKKQSIRARKAVRDLKNPDFVDLRYDTEYVEYNPGEQHLLRPGDIISFIDGETGERVEGIVFAEDAESNMAVAVYDINKRFVKVGELSFNDKNIFVRKKIFTSKYSRKFQDVIANNPKTITGNTTLNPGDALFQNGVCIGIVEDGNKERVLFVDPDGVLRAADKTQFRYLRSEEKFPYRIELGVADNIDANDFVELDNGDIVKYKDVRDDRTIKYKLISEDSFEEESVKLALKLFEDPLFDFVSSGGSESELDRRGDDPHFIIYKQVRGNVNYGGNKRVYLQARYDLLEEGVQVYAPVFDTSGYYVKESEEIEVGDVIEEVQDLKYDKRIKSAKKVQGVKLVNLSHSLVISRNGEMLKLATYDSKTDSYIISIKSINDLEKHTLFTREMEKKKVSKDELNLGEFVLSQSTPSEVEEAAISEMQKAFGGIDVVYVEQGDTNVRAWTDLKHIYINLSATEIVEGKRSIAQCYAHELSHILLAYLRVNETETYYQLLHSIKSKPSLIKALNGKTDLDSIEEYIVYAIEESFVKNLEGNTDVVKAYQKAINQAFKSIFGNSSGICGAGIKVIKNLVTQGNQYREERENLIRYVVNGKLQTVSQIQDSILKSITYSCI